MMAKERKPVADFLIFFSITRMKAQNRSVVLVLSLFLVMVPSSGRGNGVTIEQQRKDFADARTAIKRGHLKTYQRLLKKLNNYPLKGYLEYRFIRPRIKKVSYAEIRGFLQRNADSPISHRMRAVWLYSLAHRRKWKIFLQEYRDANEKPLMCYHLRARLKTEPYEQVKDEIQTMWLVGESQPSACDPAFKIWTDKGGITTDLVWERIRLAMKKRKLSLAGYLARYLKAEDRQWVERWQRMHRRPARELKKSVYKQDLPVVRDIIRHGLRRLARVDAESAMKQWERLKHRHAFSQHELIMTDLDIALAAAYQFKPQAYQWLSTVPAQALNESAREWQIRAALNVRDWKAVLDSLGALPPVEQQLQRWQYWKARALNASGNIVQAEQIYSVLAGERDYHGFLAADRLSQPYVVNDKAVPFNQEELDTISKIPGITRARELYALGMRVDARREWHHVTKKLNKRELQLAAVLADQWGWHDRAILTVARGKHFDDLALRFPIVFRKQVEKHARRYKVETAWIYGILRQESAFMTDARSSAGALGLMQLLPYTARRVARRIKSPLRRTRDLLNPNRNIRLGTAHLKRVLDRNQGNYTLATASYNAGSQRVKQWKPEKNKMPVPADIWVETVPFNETRDYIKRVLFYTAIFEKRLGNPITPLSIRMPDIRPKS